MEADPRRARPLFAPGYGIASYAEGMLEWEWATERLAGARNYWITTTKPDGAPHAAPVWGLWFDGAIVFSTSRASRKGRNLARDPRVAVHLESGDDVVIVEGEVREFAPDNRLADEYEAKYAFRPELDGNGLWLRVTARVAYAWLESDYQRTATRFVFD